MQCFFPHSVAGCTVKCFIVRYDDVFSLGTFFIFQVAVLPISLLEFLQTKTIFAESENHTPTPHALK